ncbi:MAG: hypothetical protein C0424_03465 [Sphingobacteriaceae bacterium]|nr:hypothetical protein [Sphingobacteriaceae bacterium]
MKQQYRLLLLFIAMAISLIALLAMQWYWLNEGKQTRQAQFDQAVSEALRQTNYALEAMEASRLLGKAIDQSQWVQRFDSLAGITTLYKFDTIESTERKERKPQPQSNPFVFKTDNLVEPTVLVPSPPAPISALTFELPKSSEEALRRFDSIMSNSANAPQITFKRLQTNIEQKTDSILQMFIRQDSLLISSDGKLAETRISLRAETRAKEIQTANASKLKIQKSVAKTKKTVVQRQVPIDSLLAQVTIDLIRPKLPIEQRISQEKFDSILTANLQQKGITLPFQYWITREQADSSAFVFGNRNLPPNASHLYQTQLFPNDLFHLNEQLMLYFVDESAYLRRGLTAMYLLSALLFLLIGGIFYAAIRYLMHQKRLSDIKSDFINNMSHEFKTPIATINLATDALGNEKVRAQPSQIDKYLGIIKSENRRMNQHVELVLQTARLEKKELKLNRQPIELAPLINQAISLMQMQFESKDGQIQCEPIPHVHLYADETHLLNVLTNLLDNAQKYCTKAPRVVVGVQLLGSKCHIAITDNGIGMTREEKDHIFDQFYRIPTGNLHNVKGFGLGLSYVKAIVEAHQGNIQVMSEPGKGSTFILQLPIQPTAS